MARDYVLMQYDELYRSLMRAQDLTKRVHGDSGIDLYKALGDVRRLAEEMAPAGWSPVDLGVLPLLRT
jgi:hypothetical protein